MSTNASNLSFPLQLVLGIIGVVGGLYATQYTLRSDVRDIRTSMVAQEELQKERAMGIKQAIEAQNKLQEERSNALKASFEERFNALRESIREVKARQELTQYEMQQDAKQRVR